MGTKEAPTLLKKLSTRLQRLLLSAWDFGKEAPGLHERFVHSFECSPVLMEFFARFGQWYVQKFKWLRSPGTPQPYYKLLVEVVMWTWEGFFYIPIYNFVSHKTQER